MNQFFKKDKLLRLAFLAFLVWIPFGTKKFIQSFISGEVSELNSIFLYGSDLLLVLFLFLVLWHSLKSDNGAAHKISLFPEIKTTVGFSALFLIFGAVSIFLSAYKFLAFYRFMELTLCVLLALSFVYLFRRGLVATKEIFAVLSLSALFQALVAFLQFKFQHSLGFYFLGESLTGPFVKGASKVMIAGGEILRSYGTMPHANILAAFLVLGLLGFYYFYLNSSRRLIRIFAVISIFFIGLALIFTFSRYGWLTALFATASLIIWGLFNQEYRYRVLNLALILITCLMLFLITMGWAIFPRAQLVIDNSINDRLIYNRMSLQIIKDNLSGVGMGNELLFSERTGLFNDYGLVTANRWQPIHNLYLLMAAEIGVLGLFAFLALIFKILWPVFKSKKLEIGIGCAMLLALLFSGFSDHFLWDLQSGRLMLWLTIGILLGISPRGLMDKTSLSDLSAEALAKEEGGNKRPARPPFSPEI